MWASNHTRLTHLAKAGSRELSAPSRVPERADRRAFAANPSPERVGLWCALYTVSPNLLGIGQIVMQVGAAVPELGHGSERAQADLLRRPSPFFLLLCLDINRASRAFKPVNDMGSEAHPSRTFSLVRCKRSRLRRCLADPFGFPVGAFCTTCSLVQESREIEEEEIALEQGVAPEIFYRDEEEQVQG